MSSEESPVRSAASGPQQLREDLFAPLTTISSRLELLQRITMVTPGLTDLERTVLLEGIAAAQAAAQQLGKHLEALVTNEAPFDTSSHSVAAPTSVCTTLG